MISAFELCQIRRDLVRATEINIIYELEKVQRGHALVYD